MHAGGKANERNKISLSTARTGKSLHHPWADSHHTEPRQAVRSSLVLSCHEMI